MILLSIAFYILLLCTRLTAERFNLKHSDDFELIPMFAGNHEGDLGQRNFKLTEFFDDCKTVCGTAMTKYDNLLRLVDNYMQRYVNKILTLSGMDNLSNKDQGEMNTVNFKITVSQEDLAYLKNYAKISDEHSALNSLLRLEAILGRVIVQKSNYLEQVLWFLDSMIGFLCQIIFRLLIADLNYTIMLIISFVLYLKYRFSRRKSVFVYLAIALNSMIFWDALILYGRKLKDARTERITWRMPAECDPANARWYHSVLSFIMGDRCTEYLKMVNRNPLDDVSLLGCLVETYSFYIIQTPIRVLGHSIRDFTGSLTELFHPSVRWFFTLPILNFVLVLVLLLIVILCGKKLRLSFFGASLEVEDSVGNNSRITEKTRPKRVLAYRSSRMLSTGRLFKNLEMNSATEGKESKSESPLENETSDKTKAATAQPSTANKSETEKKQD